MVRQKLGHDVPVVTNLFGTKRRVEMAFGPRPLAFVERAVRLTHELVPPTLGKLWGERDFFWQALGLGTSRVGHGPVTEVVEQPARLDRIPMLKSWPEDGGHFVTLPLVYTENPVCFHDRRRVMVSSRTNPFSTQYAPIFFSNSFCRYSFALGP